MKINSLKLIIQDMPDDKGKLFAAVYGTLIIDTGETKKDEDGVTEAKDAEGEAIKILENINFITPLNQSLELRRVIQALANEALTLKNYAIAKENGQLSHFIEAMGAPAQQGMTKMRPVTRRQIKKKK